MTGPTGLGASALLEALLALADEAELEVRVLSAAAARAENAPQESAACRVGTRIWVVLSPSDPLEHQAAVLASALRRFRAAFLEERYLTPAVRAFVEQV